MKKHLLVSMLLVFGLVALPSASRHVNAQATKVIFTATITGNGSDASPFRPSGWGTVANLKCIDIRKDETVATGRMICGADSLPGVAGVNQIGDSIGERMTAPRKAVLEAALGVTITASNVIDIIADILINHGRNDGTRWKPLRPEKDGKYKIYLGGTEPDFQTTAWYWDRYHESDGGLRADLQNGAVALAEWIDWLTFGTVEAWAASFSESWNFADNGTLNGNLTWTKVTGTAGGIVSNQASFSGTGTATLARADSDTSTSDQTVQYTLVSLTKGSGTDASMSVIGRKDSSATVTFYACESTNDANSGHALYKRVAGTRTDLATSGTDPVNGDVNLLSMSGSSISCDRNSAAFLGPVTDSSIATGTRGGVRYNGSDATSSTVVDDFTVADISTPSFGPLRRGTF